MKSAIAALLIMLGMIVAFIVEAKRDLGCPSYEGRAREICRGLARNMEWGWMGHAIVAPGWRVTFSTMREVYCGNKITIEDLAALKELAEPQPFKSKDWRLENGAVGLLTLLRTRHPDVAFEIHSPTSFCTEPNCAFNPANPEYILRGGCKSISDR